MLGKDEITMTLKHKQILFWQGLYLLMFFLVGVLFTLEKSVVLQINEIYSFTAQILLYLIIGDKNSSIPFSVLTLIGFLIINVVSLPFSITGVKWRFMHYIGIVVNPLLFTGIYLIAAILVHAHM